MEAVAAAIVGRQFVTRRWPGRGGTCLERIVAVDDGHVVSEIVEPAPERGTRRVRLLAALGMHALHPDDERARDSYQASVESDERHERWLERIVANAAPVPLQFPRDFS